MNKMVFKQRFIALATLSALVAGLGAPYITMAATVQNQTPKGIFMEMTKRLGEVNSMNYNIDLDIDKNDEDDRIHVLMYGSVDQNKITNRNQFSANIMPVSFEGEKIPSNLMINFLADSSSSTIYLNISGLPKEFIEDEKEIAKYSNTWIRYNEDTVNYILKEMASSTTPEEKMYIESQLNRLKVMQNDPARAAFQKEQYRKVTDSLFKNNALTITRLADTRLDATDKTSPFLYRLKVTVNKFGMGLFMKDFAKIISEDPTVSQNRYSDVFDYMVDDVIKSISSAKLPAMEVLVGKDDYLPRKITVSFYDQYEKKNVVNRTLTVNFDGFNSARSIVVPQQFKKLEDILKEEKVFEYLQAERDYAYDDFEDEVEFSTSTVSIFVSSSTINHTRGSDTPVVTLTEYSDFECLYCAQVQSTLNEVLKQYGDKVQLVYKHYPLFTHPSAQKAAEASECAAEQGKFWETHDMIFKNQQSLSELQLKNWAIELKLDAAKFNSCLDSGKYATKVQVDMREGAKKGVSGTPTIFINNIPLTGAQSIETFRQVIDQQLVK